MQRRGLASLVVGHVFLHSSMMGMRLAAPLWALRHGYSAFVVGLLLASASLMPVFLSLPAGRFAQKYGLKFPMRINISVACAGALAAVVYPSLVTLFIASLCIGAGTGGAIITVQRHLGRTYGGSVELTQAFGWFSLAPASASFFGPVAVGFLIDHASFQAAFALLLVFPVLDWLFVQRVTESHRPIFDQTAHQQSAWALLRAPMLRRVLLINWFLSTSWIVHSIVVPILGHEHAYSASGIGVILGAFAIAAVAVRALLPVMAKYLTEWLVITVASLVTALCFGIYPLLPSWEWMVGVSGVLGFSLGVVQPMIMSALHRITPEQHQGNALALRTMLMSASSVIMPMLLGAGAVLGVSIVFWCASAAIVLSSGLSYGLRETEEKE